MNCTFRDDGTICVNEFAFFFSLASSLMISERISVSTHRAVKASAAHTTWAL